MNQLRSIKKNIPLFLIAAFFLLNSAMPMSDIEPEDSLYSTLIELGDKKADHFINYGTREINLGKSMYYQGYFEDERGKSKRISKFFTCDNCHGTEQKNSARWLPASKLKGMVNNESWYNDDYVKKYGDLAKEAHLSLKKSIQLCASECAQGRSLNEEEMNYMLAYLWSNQYLIMDVLSDEELRELNQSRMSNQEKIKFIKNRYTQANAAHFIEPILKSDRKLGKGASPEKGKAIYQNGCMECHQRGGKTNLVLDNSKNSFKFLKRKLKKSSSSSVYEIVRKGTSPIPGYRPYMPHYTKEKMNDAELEDLVAFIQQQANK